MPAFLTRSAEPRSGGGGGGRGGRSRRHVEIKDGRILLVVPCDLVVEKLKSHNEDRGGAREGEGGLAPLHVG